MCYAAPEVVKEIQSGASMVTAQPAQDVWALGIIAVELLTGSPAFNLEQYTVSQVRTSHAAHAKSRNAGH
jgi:serine/threonine protein kinase